MALLPVPKSLSLAASLLFSLSAAAFAQSGAKSSITQYPLAGGETWTPNGITSGSDGALWFTSAQPYIGRLTTTGSLSRFNVPGDLVNGSEPYGIAAGPDGALWFTEYSAGKIGRVTTTGSFTEFPLTAGAKSGPTWITTGPDGALWFAEMTANRIGRITTTGVLTEYPVPTPRSGPNGIASGPDGAVWFTEYNSAKIGRIDMAGAISEYPVAANAPFTIASGSDGALWFTANYIIGRITTAGASTLYPLPHKTTAWAITSGTDGALWYTVITGIIGRITTRGVITEYRVPGKAEPYGIATGPDGALWFTELADYIGRAPACGLGFRASFANGTLTMNFDLGINTPANFSIHLRDASGPFAVPFSSAIPAVAPSQPITINWNPIPNKGAVTVVPQLANAAGEGICAEWHTVNTTP